MHHLNIQISPPFNSYINKQTAHVCMDANSLSVCFCCGYFLRHVRRPRMLGLSSIGSGGYLLKGTWLQITTRLASDFVH